MKLKLSRLIQPRNPLFWLMVVLNALSSAFSWILHTYELTVAATVIVAGFALANALIGIALALRLMRDDAEGAADRR
jgi:4-hydroxybenzoate polyprenyltransferase